MPNQVSTKKQPKHSPKGHTTLKPKKMGSEIDAIFAGKKRKKLETDNKAHAKKPMKVLASNDVNLHDKPKKMGSEIDDIFAPKKRKKLETDNKVHAKKPMKVLASNDVNPHDGLMRVVKSVKKKSSRENEPIKPVKRTSTRSRKKTAEGLTIYTEDELGFGKANAGGTRLCPFDCDCCF